jgi:hypothetical protein
VYLNRSDIEKILEVMDKFPEAKNFELTEEGNNGIGTVLTLTVDTTVNGMSGSFSVEISGVEDW